MSKFQVICQDDKCGLITGHVYTVTKSEVQQGEPIKYMIDNTWYDSDCFRLLEI